MTKVTIKPNQVPEKPIVHKIGNWYKTSYGDYAILANVKAKAVLIYTDGSFQAEPVDYVHYSELTQAEFKQCCGTYGVDTLKLLPNITISEE